MDDIRQLSKNKCWIFIDFFETLVHRTKSEDLIRRIWAKRVSEEIKYSISAVDIYQCRCNAGKSLLRLNTEIEEITYHEVIHEIYVKYHALLKEYSFEEFENICFVIEIETELKYLQPNIEIVNILTELKSEGKKIAIISDYEMPKEAIEEYLKKLKIKLAFDNIFVSSDFNARKRSGNLYRIILQKLGKVDALMIGDNKKSDYEMAMEVGIEAYNIEAKQSINVYFEQELRKIERENNCYSFSNYGFMLYMFIERLYMRLVNESYCNVLFLAREGYFLKQLFDKYQENAKIKIKTNYCYVSRRSTLLASVYKDTTFDFSSLFLTYNKLDVYSFLKNLSFDDQEINKCLENCPYNISEMKNNFKDSKEYQWIMDNQYFRDVLDKKTREANGLLRQYLLQLNPEESSFVIVDVGWKGTIQDNIYAALQERCIVHGFYFGLENTTGKESNKNIKEGLVFTKIPRHSKNFACFNFETHLFEQLLAAPHGSTIGYVLKNEEVYPVLEEYLEDDLTLFEATNPIQLNFIEVFEKIKHLFEVSEMDSYTAEKILFAYCLRGMLCLNKGCIQYEGKYLNSKTNNFGWFNKSPVSQTRKSKIKVLLRDVKRIKQSKLGGMALLNYFAVKSNARRKYKWKIPVYRIVYYSIRIKYRVR